MQSDSTNSDCRSQDQSSSSNLNGIHRNTHYYTSSSIVNNSAPRFVNGEPMEGYVKQ
ncbi:MAG: hypothetical protein MHPSP_002595, partial [Paramarteilia canceri]